MTVFYHFYNISAYRSFSGQKNSSQEIILKHVNEPGHQKFAYLTRIKANDFCSRYSLHVGFFHFDICLTPHTKQRREMIKSEVLWRALAHDIKGVITFFLNL